MDLWRILERAARLHGGDLAVVDGAFACDYRALHARARALAAFLRAEGVRAGDRVAILCWNGHAYLETYFAAAGARAILCPLNVRLSAPELADILRDADARWLVADASFEELVRSVLASGVPLAGVVWTGGSVPAAPGVASHAYEDALRTEARAFEPGPVERDAVAQLYFTSGTTGRSKGVALTHQNVWTHALATIGELGLDALDRWAHVAPLFHLADAWATFAITWVGGVHVLLPRFDALAALDLLERERVTITNLVPTMLNRMVHEPSARGRDWSHLRRILSGGAPIAETIVREIALVFGCEYVQTYGMTETSPYLTLSLPPRRRRLSREEDLRVRCTTGRPFAAIELRVVDEGGRDVPADDRAVGEIWVRGPTVTPGYWNRPEETRAAFEQGWLKTGDLARIDADGYVTIVDRKKDMILTGGENVYSTEVEHVLHRHPAVLEAAVFGAPDPDWGEVVLAAVVFRDAVSVSVEELQAFCRTALAAYKVPRAVLVVPELPRTGSHKIAKRLLRERFAERGGEGAASKETS